MLTLLFRVLLLLTIVLISFRLMGKRQIGSFQPFEFVITLLVADVIAQSVVETSGPIMEGIVPLVGFIIFQFILSLISVKSKKARDTISGESITIMKNGRILQKNIEDLLLSMDDILEQLRIKGKNDLEAISDIFVETDGSISVVMKDSPHYAITLAENGKIDAETIKKLSISAKAFKQAMDKSGIAKEKDIFWAYYYKNRITIIPKEPQGGPADENA